MFDRVLHVFFSFIFLSSVPFNGRYMLYATTRLRVDVCVFLSSFLPLSSSFFSISAESTATHTHLHTHTERFCIFSVGCFFYSRFHIEHTYSRIGTNSAINRESRENANGRQSTSNHLPILWDHFYFIIISWFTIIIFSALSLWPFSSLAIHMRDDMAHWMAGL